MNDYNISRSQELFERIGLDETLFNFRGYTRLKQLKYLLETAQIDSSFFWQA